MCLKRAAYLVVREVRIVTSHGFLLLSPWWDTQPHVYTVYLDPVISLDALVKYEPSTSLSQKCLPHVSLAFTALGLGTGSYSLEERCVL